MLSETKSFDTFGSEQAARDFVSYINKLKPGNIIAIAVCDEASAKIKTGKPSCADVIKQLGSKEIDHLGYRVGWVKISSIKDNNNGKVLGQLLDEAIGETEGSEAVCEKTIELSIGSALGAAGKALGGLKSLGK